MLTFRGRYERSLEEIQDKFLKECETSAGLKSRVNALEEQFQSSNTRVVELELQLRRCIAEAEVDAQSHAHQLNVSDQSISQLQSAALLQQQEIDRLQTAATEGSAVLASERDLNRVLHERCRALEGCVQEYQFKLQHQQQEIEENQSKHRQLEGSVQAHELKLQLQQQEMNQLEELMAQSNMQHTAALLQEQGVARTAHERCQHLEGLHQECQSKLQETVQACAELTACLRQKEDLLASTDAKMRELTMLLQQSQSSSQSYKDEATELSRQLSQAVMRSSALQQQNDALSASSKDLAAHARNVEAQAASGAPLQAARAGYERAVSDIKVEFHQRLRATKVFAAEYVSNSLEGLFFATAAVFFMKWRLAVAVISKAETVYVDQQGQVTPSHMHWASSRRATPELRALHQLHADDFERAHRPMFATPPAAASPAHSLTLANQHRAVGSHMDTSSSAAAADDAYLTASGIMREACALLCSVSSDLQTHAADLQSLVTSAATAINESPLHSDTLTQALATYLRAVSQCEARLHDMNFPLFSCTQNLQDASDSLSPLHNEFPHESSFDAPIHGFSALLGIASQLMDTGSAVERAVRTTEPFSVQLASLLVSLSAAGSGLVSSRTQQQQHDQAASSRISAVRSSINRVLGEVLSCSDRIASCASAISSCHDHISRAHEPLADSRNASQWTLASVPASRGERREASDSGAYAVGHIRLQ